MRRAACLQASTERVRTEAQRPFTRWLVIKAPPAVMGLLLPHGRWGQRPTRSLPGGKGGGMGLAAAGRCRTGPHSES